MKIKSLLFVGLIIALLTACNDGAAATQMETTVAESTPEESTSIDSSEEQETRSDLEAMGDFNTEKGLFNVELNIPKEFVGEKTQDELDTTAKELGYKSITLNDDGSATYVMTKKQHKTMMDGVKESLNSTLQDMVGSEDYPNYTNISTNADFTEFEITTKSTELDFGESFSVLGFYMYGAMYNAFNGTQVDNISVTFINADSGDVIDQLNSKDMGNENQ